LFFHHDKLSLALEVDDAKYLCKILRQIDRRPLQMKINLALWDRILRFVFGIILTGWAVAGGPWPAFFGVYLILTSGWGLCPLYGIFRIRTAKLNERPSAPPE
jgi:hypothetical protein